MAYADTLNALRAEEALLVNVKRAAGIVGLLCIAAFGYTAIMELPSKDPALSTAVLVGASALVAMVFLVTRHTNRTRAQLRARIRDLNGADEPMKTR